MIDKHTSLLYYQIVEVLISAGKESQYPQDANEYDPRYKAYGVRAPAMRSIIKSYKKDIASLTLRQKVDLISLLVNSEYGEQQTISFYIMLQAIDFYVPADFHLLNEYISHMFGWSKIDGFAGTVMPKLLKRYPKQVVAQAREWNNSSEKWPKEHQ